LADEQTIIKENETPTPEVKQDLKAQLEAEQQAKDKLVAEAAQPLQQRIAQLEADFEGAKAAYAFAVADYKKLLILANPLFTEELIAGNSIEELKASAQKASGVIAKVREGLEKASSTEAATARIPAGAPPRKEPDIGSMSTVEKINYGLDQAKKKSK
jgi:hypothetical protein